MIKFLLFCTLIPGNNASSVSLEVVSTHAEVEACSKEALAWYKSMAMPKGYEQCIPLCAKDLVIKE